MNVSWFTKMFLKILTTCIYHISADFTGVFLSKSMQFVEPEGNWFTVPSKGEFKGVIDKIIAWPSIVVFFRSFGRRVQCFVL